MKKNLLLLAFFCCCSILILSCNDDYVTPKPAATPISAPVNNQLPAPTVPPQTKSYTYLALGDSYTIGQSVCETCRFPEQLKKSLGNLNALHSYSLKVIAQTGWTTTSLLSAINAEKPSPDYDLVTLLIGVNNQYQNIGFGLYEVEFPQLVNKAITLAKGDKSNLIVVSIPDYAYTSFGKQSGNSTKISAEIDKYNAFAQQYCSNNNIEFVNITDITRLGLADPSLVASDGLHPSEKAYSLFVERILPKASLVIHN